MSQSCKDTILSTLKRAIIYGYLPKDFESNIPSDNLQASIQTASIYLKNGYLSEEEYHNILESKKETFNKIYELIIKKYSYLANEDEEIIRELKELDRDILFQKIRDKDSDFYFNIAERVCEEILC